MQRALILLLLCLAGGAATAQQYRFRNYSIEEGLSQSVVNCVFQDSRGFLWVGTQNGLNRFNGYDFTVFLFNSDDTNTISNNWIYAIAEDRNGDLWIGTKGGLNKYVHRENRFRRINYSTGFPQNMTRCVYDVLVSEKGRIFINTPPLLSVFDPVLNIFTHFNTGLRYLGTVNDNRIPLMEDGDGDIWVGSLSGLACFDPVKKHFNYFDHRKAQRPMIPDERITALCQDNRGLVWIGTANGLVIFDKKNNSFSNISSRLEHPLGPDNSCIRSILQDPAGAMWVATEGGGLNRLIYADAGKLKMDRYTVAQNGLGHNIVLCLACDRSQNLWAGTLRGLSQTDLKPARFSLYRNDNTSSSVNLLGNVIASIYKDDDGSLWVGNWGQGLNIYNRKTGNVDHYSTRHNGIHHINNDFVHVIFRDKNGNVWIGTRDGIRIFDRRTRSFREFGEVFPGRNLPDFRGIRITMITPGSDKGYWIATQSGLFRINPGMNGYETFSADQAGSHHIGGNLVYCVREDRDGYIWIATINGLDVYNPRTSVMTHFRKSTMMNSLCDDFVISLCEDHRGDMWIGTGSYVNRYVKKDSAFIYYSKEDGLPNNNIFEILRDHTNTMWFATGGGLCRFDPATGRFRNYTVDEGLQSLEFNLRACCNSPDGEVFFGGMNGFNSFYPGNLKDNPNIPEILFTSCYKMTRTGREDVDFGKDNEIVLRYSDQAFTVEFIALEFTNPAKNQYAYRLEGISDDWINIGNRRFVPFSNLSPGEYILRVKGSNNDGIWNEKGATLRIVILPPWWRSWWALTAYLLIIIGGVVIYVRMRERKLVLERNLLERKVHERTLQIERNNLEITQKNETLNQLNQELTALNATKDKFFSIIAHDLRNPFNSILGLADIAIGTVDSGDTTKMQKTVTDIRDASRHAFDLLQNLLMWARSQTGNLEFRPVEFDLMERVQENIDLVMGQARRKNITIDSELSETLMVCADLQMINTILRNLLTNAIKFTGRDGRVVVSAVQTDGYCNIRVCDNGTGMTRETLDKLFRIDSKYTRKGTEKERGTGLGLILCKEFIEKHHGSISIETEPEKGSCFTVSLPVGRPQD